MERGTLHMPRAQKYLGKTLLYPTVTGGFSNKALIPTENSFYFPTEKKNYSTAASPVDPSHRVLGIRAWLSWRLVRVQDGLGAAEPCGPVPAEQRLAVMGGEACPLGCAQMRDSRGPWGDGSAPAQAASAPTLAAKPIGAAVGFRFLVISGR